MKRLPVTRVQDGPSASAHILAWDAIGVSYSRLHQTLCDPDVKKQLQTSLHQAKHRPTALSIITHRADAS